MKEEYDAAKKLSKVVKGKRLFKEGKVLEAAFLGYPKAIARLASLAEGEKLYDEGKVLEAANLGYPEAMGEMARNYFEGANGFEKDYAKGIKLAMKAANEGDEVGMFYLGYCYLIGSSVARNYAFALSSYHILLPSSHIFSRIYLFLDLVKICLRLLKLLMMNMNVMMTTIVRELLRPQIYYYINPTSS